MSRSGTDGGATPSLQDHVKRIDEEEVVAEGDGLDLNRLLVEILKIDSSVPFKKQLILLTVLLMTI